MKQKYNSKIKILSFFMLVNLLYNTEILKASGIIVDNTAEHKNQANVGKTKNNIDQVDIVNPNENGTSHNKFLEYNVSDKGVILNNSMNDTKTTLGGYILGNKNLKKEADLIITEVTGNKLSEILGYTEIAGKKADYILANPNGVRINGGGFLNTKDVTITTGSVLDDPLLTFKVRQGLVEVGEKGVNTGGIDYFSLISKTAKISGLISTGENEKRSKEVKIVTGSNDYEYKSKKVIDKSSEDMLSENKVGIDTGNLGGILANRITLISTNKGVGVNAKGPLIADVEDITIDSKGDIVLKSVKAKKDINLKTGEKVDVSTEGVLNGEKIKIESKTLKNSGVVLANSILDINSEKIENEKSGELISKKTLKLKAKDTITNKNLIQGKTLDVDTDNLNNEKNARMIGLEKLTIKSRKKVSSEGSLYSEKDVELNVKDLENKEGSKILSQEKIKINSTGEVNNQGNIQSKELELSGQKVTIGKKGQVIGLDDLKVEAKESLKSEGLIYGKKKGSIKSKELTNEGSIFVNDELVVTSEGKLENTGTIQGGSKVKVDSKNLTNKRDIFGKEVDITTKEELENAGAIQGDGKVKLKGKKIKTEAKSTIVGIDDLDIEAEEDITTSGTIYGEKKIDLKAKKKLENKGLIQGKNKVNLKAENITNEEAGVILAKDKLEIKTDEKLDNKGIIEGKKDTEIATKVLTTGDKSKVVSGDKLHIDAKENITSSGTIFGEKEVGIKTKKLTNEVSGKILTRDKLQIKVSDELDNKGIIEGKKDTKIATKVLTTGDKSKVVSGDKLHIDAKENITSSGTIFGEKEIDIKTKNLTNEKTGVILAKGKLDLKVTEKLDNKGIIEGKKDTKIATKVLTTGDKSKIVSSGKLDIDAKENITSSGTIFGEKEVDIKTKNLTNEKTGVILAKGKLDLNVTEKLDNKGIIEGKKDTKIATKVLTTEEISELISGSKLDIDTKESITSSGTIYGKGAVDVKTKKLDIESKGRLLAKGKLDIKDTDSVNNKGVIQGESEVDIKTKKLTTEKDSKIVSVDKLDINIEESITSKGTIYGESEVDIKTKDFTNEKSGVVSAKGKLDITTEKLTNKGIVQGEKETNVKSKVLTTEETSELISGGKLNINTEESITSKGTIYGESEVDIKTKKLDIESKGRLLAKGKLDIKDTGSIYNKGIIQGEDKVQLKTKKLTTEKDSKIVSTGDLDINAEDRIESNGTVGGKNVTVKTKELENKEDGVLFAKGKLKVTSDSKITNRGAIQGEGEVEIKTDSIDMEKDSKLIALGKSKLEVKNIDNKGTVYGGDIFDIVGEKFENAGKIFAKTLGLKYENHNIELGGDILSSDSTKVNAKNIKLKKDIVNEGSLDLDAKEKITLSNNIESYKDVKLKAKNLENLKNISSGQNLEIDIHNDLINNGELKSYKDLKINTNNHNISNDGRILAQGNLTLEGKEIKNGKSENISIGSIKSQSRMDLSKELDEKGNKSTLIFSGKDMKLKGDNLTNGAGGTILSLDGKVDLEFKDKIHNQANLYSAGVIKSGKDMTIKAKDLINDAAKYKNMEKKGNYYTEQEIKAKVKKKNDINLPLNIEIENEDFNEHVHIKNYGISNWQNFKGQDFYEVPKEFQDLSNGGISGAKRNGKKYYEQIGIFYSNVSNPTGSRYRQGEVNSGGKLDIDLSNNLTNKGVITANDDINIKASEIKNITEVDKIEKVVKSFTTKTVATLNYLGVGSAWGRGRVPTKNDVTYEMQGISEIKTKDIIVPSETVARITSNKNINFNSTIVQNVNTKGELINGKDYQKYIKKNYKDGEREKLIKGILEENSEQNFNKKLNELQKKVFDEKKKIEIDSLNKKIQFDLEEQKKLQNKLELEKDITKQNEIRKEIENLSNKINENKSNLNEVIKSELKEETPKVNKEDSKDVDKKLKEKVLTEAELNKIHTNLSTKNYLEIINGNSGLFKVNENKNKPLIETNIEFIDLNKFYASEYFFKKIGKKPEKNLRQLGDAYYETTLVNKVINNNFGNLFKKENVNESLLMKSLLDNAVEESKTNKNLKIGRALSKEDIQKLNKNIVWYVEIEVNGEKVLAPQLYIAKKGLKDFTLNQGSTISGENVKIEGDLVRNIGGNILAENILDINVGKLENISTGSKAIVKGRENYITSVDDIVNKGGEIIGKDINLLDSSSGNVINESIKERINTDKEDLFREEISHIGKIESQGLTSITADKNFIQKGGVTKGKNVNVKVKEDIKLEALELNENSHIEGGYSLKKKDSNFHVGTSFETDIKSLTHKESVIEADGFVNLDAEKNVNLKGSTIKGNNVFISGDKVKADAIKDVKDENYASKTRDSQFYEDFTEESHTEKLVKNQIIAKNNLSIEGTKDVTLVGTDRSSGGVTHINSKTGSVNEKAAELNNTSDITHKRTGNIVQLDEEDLKKSINGKVGLNANPGVVTDVDNLLNRGFKKKELISKYGASGSMTNGTTTLEKKELTKETIFDKNKIFAGEQLIQGEKGVLRKGFDEVIRENSYVDSKNGNVKIESVQNKVEKKVEINSTSYGGEVGYKAPILNVVENAATRAEYSINSENSAFNAKKNGKQSIGAGTEASLRALETLGDLSKITEGTDIVSAYNKIGVTTTTINKDLKQIQGIDNTSIVGGKSSYSSNKLVSIQGLQGETNDLDVRAKDFKQLSNTEKTNRKESGHSHTVEFELNGGVDKDGLNVGFQFNVDSSTVNTNSQELKNNLSKLKVKNNASLTVENNARIEGLIEADTIDARIGNKLDVTSKQDKINSMTHNTNTSASAGFVASTSGISRTGSLGGTYGINQEKKSWVKEQAGLIAKKGFDLKTKVLNLTGALFGSLKKDSTKISADKINVNNLKDVHNKTEIYAGGGVGIGKNGISSTNVKLGIGEGFDKRQDTNTTIGTGNINSNSKLENVNTDFNKSQVKTKDFVIGKFDLDFTKNKKLNSKKNKPEDDEIASKYKSNIDEDIKKPKIEVEDSLYGGKVKGTEEHIYEEIKTPKVNSVYDEVRVERLKQESKIEVENPLYGGKVKGTEEHIYEEIKTPKVNSVYDEVRAERLKQESKIEVENPLNSSINVANEHKISRINSEIEELKENKKLLDEKIDAFVKRDKKLLKQKEKLDKLQSGDKKAEVLKEKFLKELEKKNSSLVKELKTLNEKDNVLKDNLETAKNKKLLVLESEVELSKKNYGVLESEDVQTALKADFKKKFGVEIDPKDSSVIKLEKKALNKMVYETTETERNALKDKINSIPRKEKEDISKEIADSVILSSKTLSKSEELQGKVQDVVKEFLNSKGDLTVEGLAKLNKEIRVEEADSNKQIFKTDHLTKEGAVFTDPLVSKQYLENFVEWYNKTSQTKELEPLEKAALAYQRLMTYHPFAEGNGRVTRVIVNKILLENGYAPLPKFSGELTKRVLPQSSNEAAPSYTAREFVDRFVDEIKTNTNKTDS